MLNLSAFVTYLLAQIENIPPEVLEKLPADVVEKLKSGVLDKIPQEVLEKLPASLLDQIPSGLKEAAAANPLFAVVGVVAVLGFIWGMVKGLLKLAIILAGLAAAAWFFYLR